MKFRIPFVIMLIISAAAITGAENKGKSIVLPIIQVEMKAGEGKNRVEAKCSTCHSLDYITTQPAFTRAQWTGTVKKMANVMGAPLTDADIKEVVDYLVRNYGTGD